MTPLTYPFTASYRLAYRHYLLSLTGYVKPEDEPGPLLKASIKRARASVAAARKVREYGRIEKPDGLTIRVV